MKFPRNFFIFYFIILFFSLAGFVLAQQKLEINYPEIAGFKPEVITKDILPSYVKYIFNFAVATSSAVALAILIYAGFLYITSAGSVSQIQKAKEKIGQAVLGLAILLGSYLILTTVNPQLTFINLPELTKPELISPEPVPSTQKQTLSAIEIPLGALIENEVAGIDAKINTEEGIFADTRLNRIKEIYQKIDEKTKKIKNLSGELNALAAALKALTDSCACGYTNPYTQSCSYDPSGASCPVKDPGSCRNDPCLSRSLILAKNSEINQKKAEIKTALDELKPWQEKLDFEIKDFQRITGVYQNAQNKINNCLNTAGLKATNLLNYYDFARYKEIVDTKATYEKMKIQAWPNAAPKQDTATFYCVEQEVGTGMVSNLPAEEAQKQIIPPEIGGRIQGPEVSCSKEITIGNIFDDSNALAQEIITNLNSLYQKNGVIIAETEKIVAIEDLNNFISQIDNYNCRSGCYSWKVRKCIPGGEDAPPICWWEYYCKVTPVPCAGTPGTNQNAAPQSDISSKVSQIDNSYRAIKNNQNEIEEPIVPNLKKSIEEAESETVQKTKPGKILDTLSQNRTKLTDSFCSNSKVEWEGFLAGSAISEKGFYSYEQAKAMGWIGQAKNKNNYFCCESKTPAAR